ncbi:MAG TPA: HD domain-containing phosphohydrolase, partial [Solirubrobacteraceae bacterium]|nr:HD domain-containing phosphohydrolase [Solirubrobacteraceae bacterium]
MEQRSVWPHLGVVAAVLAAGALVLLAGAALADTPTRWPVVAALALLAAASAATAAAWRAAHRRHARERDALGAAVREAEQQLDRERAVNHEAERRLDDERKARRRDEQERRALRDALTRHREAVARLQRSWQAERAWSRELRGQLHDVLTRARATAGDGDDVHSLVLRAAIELVGAEKGMLLSRRDADADGDLDLVVARGFAHDPQRSAVAQRFARAVLERDEIVREDEPSAPAGHRTPADEEIEALVATPLYLRDRFEGVVICANREGGFEDVDDEVLLALGDHAGAALHHGRLHRDVAEAHRGVIRALLEAVAARRPSLQQESAELAVRAVTLAQALDFEQRERDVLVIATLLRAVGELGLPDRVLLEPGPLSDEQRAVLQVHPRVAFGILGQIPALRDVASAILYHHERFDGDGYPAGLAGHDIPLPARALAVLEAYGAMTHDRPHRPARAPEIACEELVAVAGRQLDPEIVALFVDEVRAGRGTPRPELADAILDALPIVPDVGAGGDLEPLATASTDGLTLLGNHRALQQALLAAVADARTTRRCAVVLVELEDLARINAAEGHGAGDRTIQLAARAVQRAAARLGGTAFRASGRRFAVLAPLRGREPDAV